MQLIAVREAFDRRDFIALMRDRETEAGINSPAIHQDGAGAALSVVATFFRPGQVQTLAQCVEQRDTRIDLERMVLAVNF